MRAINRAVRRSSGFTLLEMMLVVVIIGILATVVVINIAGQGDEAKRGATITKLSQIKAALATYYTKNNGYPGSLTALVPTLLEKVPNDAWDRPLVYYSPGQEAGKPYSLYSAGADGQNGTADDINAWTMDEHPAGGG
jgi:general secretion pathway protein G